jgi:pimeloyl-ACP methyl ester carboxylesterase
MKPRISLAVLTWICVLWASALAMAEAPATTPTWENETLDTWHGYKRHNFTVDGCRAWVVEPKTPLSGNPWTWCLEFPDAFTERTGVLRLLDKGFYHVHVSVGNTFGCPKALQKFDSMYAAITAKGLAKRGALIGISRGGLYAHNWASLNPEKVACLYGDAPVCDFKSWPGGKGIGRGSRSDWQALLKCYEFKDEAAALEWAGNPIDSLAALAQARVPILHVVGDDDDVVPVAENTDVLAPRYRAMGGPITVIHKPKVGHHPHGLDDPQPVVDFILKHAQVLGD